VARNARARRRVRLPPLVADAMSTAKLAVVAIAVVSALILITLLAAWRPTTQAPVARGCMVAIPIGFLFWVLLGWAVQVVTR
jgi:cytochrome bd-type quinol oxidase subunit 1